ncbi:MAG: serine/threonine-protein kinase [Verrucomicrobiota bacterium]
MPIAIRWQNTWRLVSVGLGAVACALALVVFEIPEIRITWPLIAFYLIYTIVMRFGCPVSTRLTKIGRIAIGFFDLPFWLLWFWINARLSENPLIPASLLMLTTILLTGIAALSLKKWELIVVAAMTMIGAIVLLLKANFDPPGLLFVVIGVVSTARAGFYAQNRLLPFLEPSAMAVDAKAAFRMASTGQTQSSAKNWEPPAPEDLDTLLSNLEVRELLGRGGMGAVYRAIQSELQREVAVKVLPPEFSDFDPSFTERFRREAQAMAALDHPNIVAIHDFGQSEADHFFIVMELVDGLDLHQVIQHDELSESRILEILSGVCHALEYAHENGFVHRDIKPANILIRQDGRVKVGDFGLAKAASLTSREPLTGLTEIGTILGTPSHSAPEQLDGHEVDHRADIFSLGVLLYEMVTGKVPRGAFSPLTNPELHEIVNRAMQPDPIHRFQSAAEFREALAAVVVKKK